jgi:hypothetical protein
VELVLGEKVSYILSRGCMDGASTGLDWSSGVLEHTVRQRDSV